MVDFFSTGLDTDTVICVTVSILKIGRRPMEIDAARLALTSKLNDNPIIKIHKYFACVR
jgi:hypothetical protein